MNPVYTFLLNMWIMRKVDEPYLQGQVNKGRLSEEEKEMILASPQVLKQEHNA
ncbi:hypothetical protein [Bacillus testis]|uniref:hypothetical protein n=1 Tax=Bacillus testis TaxID=1622072 RepID=UPI000AF4CC39|nr:hypothetical protein [Bacillus testis]